MARTIRAAGGRPGMMAHIAYGYGLFTGGLGYHYGAERLGCTIVPVSGGMTERQVQLIGDFEPDILMATPSYALCLVDEFRDAGARPAPLLVEARQLRRGAVDKAMRDELEDAFDIDALDSYGLSEVIGPGVAGECVETKDGLHIWEDHFYPEIVDPLTGAALTDGEFGELVFTSLTKEAMPVVRYRTGDLTRLLPGTARSMRRMARVSGRSDDMMIVRGVNVFPTQIEELLLGVPSLSPHYQLILSREGRLDELEVQVEARSPSELDAARADAARELAHAIKEHIGVSRESERAEAGRDRTIARQGETRHRQEAEGMTSSTASPSTLRARCRPARGGGRANGRRAVPKETGDYESGRAALWLVLAPVGAPPADAAAEAAAERG